MVELASDLLIESVWLEMLFLLMHLSSQTDLSFTFKLFSVHFIWRPGLHTPTTRTCLKFVIT